MRFTRNRLAAVLVAAALCAPVVAAAQLKIGFMGELSGPQGPLGQDQYDALMLLIEQNGGRLGGVPVQVLREDSQLKPDVANQIVERLIDKERVPSSRGSRSRT